MNERTDVPVRTTANYIAETIDCLPPPGDTPLERLRHTVAAHVDTPAHDMAVDATCGIYAEGRTGLTFGDLRELEQAIREDERQRMINQLSSIEPIA